MNFTVSAPPLYSLSPLKTCDRISDEIPSVVVEILLPSPQTPASCFRTWHYTFPGTDTDARICFAVFCNVSALNKFLYLLCKILYLFLNAFIHATCPNFILCDFVNVDYYNRGQC
jgi:hypothetical protein